MAKTLAIRPYLHSISRVRLFRGPLPIFQSSNLSFLPQHRLGDGFQKRQPLQIRDPKFMMVVQRFTTRATHVNDPGSIDSPLMQSMENKVTVFFLSICGWFCVESLRLCLMRKGCLGCCSVLTWDAELV